MCVAVSTGQLRGLQPAAAAGLPSDLLEAPVRSLLQAEHSDAAPVSVTVVKTPQELRDAVEAGGALALKHRTTCPT